MCCLNSLLYRFCVTRPSIIPLPSTMSCLMPSAMATKRAPGVPIKTGAKKPGTGHHAKASKVPDVPMPKLLAEQMFPDEKEEENRFVKFGQPIKEFRETGLRFAMFEVDLLDTSSSKTVSKEEDDEEEKVKAASDDEVSDNDDDDDDKPSPPAKEKEEEDEEKKEGATEENRKAAMDLLTEMNQGVVWEEVLKSTYTSDEYRDKPRVFTAFPYHIPNILAGSAEEKRIALRFDMPQGMSQAHLANWVASQGRTSLLLPGPKTCGITSQLMVDKHRRFHAALVGARIISAQNNTSVSFRAKLASADPKQRDPIYHSNPAGIMSCPDGCCDKGSCADSSGLCPVLSSGHSAGPIEPESLARLFTLAGKAKDAFNSPDGVRLAHITDELVDAEVAKLLTEDGDRIRIPLPSTDEEALFPEHAAVYLAINYAVQLRALGDHHGLPVTWKKSKKGGRKFLYVAVEVYRGLVQWLKKFTDAAHYSVNLAGPMHMALEPLDGQHGWHAMRSQGLVDMAQMKRTSTSLSVTLEVCLVMLPKGLEGPPMTDNHLEHLCEEDIDYRGELGLAVHQSLAREAEPRAFTKEQLTGQKY